jgi:hypothetical protein
MMLYRISESVALRAVRLSGIGRDEPLTASYILGVRHGFKVVWVTARGYSAQMVKLSALRNLASN